MAEQLQGNKKIEFNWIYKFSGCACNPIQGRLERLHQLVFKANKRNEVNIQRNNDLCISYSQIYTMNLTDRHSMPTHTMYVE